MTALQLGDAGAAIIRGRPAFPAQPRWRSLSGGRVVGGLAGRSWAEYGDTRSIATYTIGCTLDLELVVLLILFTQHLLKLIVKQKRTL